MCQRTVRKVHNEGTQRIFNEEEERRLLAAYIHGLRGIVGQQVQFQMPSTMEQAVRLPVTVENTEKHRQPTGGARKAFATKRESECFRCAKKGHYARDCRQDPYPSGQNVRHDQRDFPSRDPQSARGDRGRGRPGFQNFRKPTRKWASSEATKHDEWLS
jgi:hypothetical protein